MESKNLTAKLFKLPEQMLRKVNSHKLLTIKHYADSQAPLRIKSPSSNKDYWTQG